MLDFVSTRRDVLKTGGALLVTFTLAERFSLLGRRAVLERRLSDPTKSTDSCLSMLTGRSLFIPVKSISGPDCVLRSRRSRPKSSTCRSTE